MAYFPIFRDLENQNVLIVGGGVVALRKAEKLIPFGPKLTVVAPEIRKDFEKLNAVLIRRPFQPEDIGEKTMLVIAACNDRAVNEAVCRLCRERSIPVNVVDNPALCTFLFPSLIKRGKLTVGISTSGASPSAAIWVKENVEQLLPDQMEEILDWLEDQRRLIKDGIPTESARSACLKKLFAACMACGGVLRDEERDEIVRRGMEDKK